MERYIEKPTNESFDVVVVGGGISGACVAYEAASRGLKVALFEKGDFGGATSAATSKLIHGGLRYLNYLEFGLVRESLRERRILEDIAPNLVYPLPFLIPNYGGLKSNRWIIKAGMILYDLLSFDKARTKHSSKRLPNHRMVSKKGALELAPMLPEKGLTGGAIYYDCQSMAPERLTLAFIKSAAAFGAKVSNYAEVVGMEQRQGKITGAVVKDVLTGKKKRIQASLFINSGGPWADRIIKRLSGEESSHSVRMSEGIHIIGPALSHTHALVLLTPGGRHFFAIPWRGKSLYGTTDKDYQGNPDDYRVTRSSIEEFIEEINSTLGRTVIDYKSIVHAYGGLRPLTDTHTESSYKSSRKYEIFDGASEGLDGLITVEGGKYTTSRNLAESVLSVIEKKLGRKLPTSKTSSRPLFGSNIDSLTEFMQTRQNVHQGMDAKTLDWLAVNYGTEMDAIVQIAADNPALSQVLDKDGEILAQVVYAARFEMARKLSDVLQRRTGLGTLGMPSTSVINKVAAIMQKQLKWSAAKVRAEIKEATEALRLPK
ncbi:MAG: glycerol-3-phosphate dehydrogenase/oxidase [Leptospiraceae bacterium]|nr:glycerol-3-phosphate dehydrogenase/oxidase [Leptospiraceae bacterium]